MNQTTITTEQQLTREILGDAAIRVLLAEDDKICQYLCRQVLERCGFAVTAVGDGKQAVDAAVTGDYDVFLTDLFMPVMDGLDAAAEIRRNEAGGGRRLPIIAVTSYELEEERKGADVDDYISKPFNLPELLRAIGRLVVR